MRAFHAEHAVRWVWLPTPLAWLTQDIPGMIPDFDGQKEQILQHAALQPPAKELPDALMWHAWDSRTSHLWGDLPVDKQHEWYQATLTIPRIDV